MFGCAAIGSVSSCVQVVADYLDRHCKQWIHAMEFIQRIGVFGSLGVVAVSFPCAVYGDQTSGDKICLLRVGHVHSPALGCRSQSSASIRWPDEFNAWPLLFWFCWPVYLRTLELRILSDLVAVAGLGERKPHCPLHNLGACRIVLLSYFHCPLVLSGNPAANKLVFLRPDPPVRFPLWLMPMQQLLFWTGLGPWRFL